MPGLSVSLGLTGSAYPSDDSYLPHRNSQGLAYFYTAGLKSVEGPSLSPFSTGFRPMHINRIEVSGASLKTTLAYCAKHPELRYGSDGNPTVVSAPKDLAAALGNPLADLGRPVVVADAGWFLEAAEAHTIA